MKKDKKPLYASRTEMPSIRDIARACMVSPTTVSNVLNARGGEVSDETRHKVLDAVRLLGYRAPAAPIEAIDVKTIGVVMRLGDQSPFLGNHYYSHIMDGLVGAAIRKRWVTSLFMDSHWEDADRAVRQFCDGRTDGLILVTAPPECPIVRVLSERGVPFVVVGSGNDDPSLTSVDIDNVRGATLAVEHLVSQGHRRIGLFSGGMDNSMGRERLAGYRTALEAAGIRYRPEWIWELDYRVIHGQQMAKDMLRLSPADRPTAIFCGNDAIAVGAMQWLASEGFKVPQDFSIIGFDDSNLATVCNPGLSTVRQPCQRIGSLSIDLLDELLRERPSEPRKVLMRPELIIRMSTAPPTG